MYNKIIKDLKKVADNNRSKHDVMFFKTGSGQYGEGDKFRGVSGKHQNPIAKKYYKEASLEDCSKLLDSKWHDERQTALRILRLKFEKSKDEKVRKQIYDLYLKKRKGINNWDLVDVSAPSIVGGYLLRYSEGERRILYKFARSKDLWEKRIAIIATYGFIRASEFENTLEISKILLYDDHDLIHKAVGWMLREVGNRDRVVEEKFLKGYYKEMPRTMLRYAIEKFPEGLRQRYLKGKF